MAEVSQAKAEILANIFLQKYNPDFGSLYVFDSSNGAEYDILCKNPSNKKDVLKIQVVESVPTRGKELVSLKNFEANKDDDVLPQHLQSDELRIEEVLGHKTAKYPPEVQKQLVILIDFGLFRWADENLEQMKLVAEKFKGNFKAVYCIHDGSNSCERLT